MKNLLIVHLESISRQRLAAFASSFPNLRRLMGEALVFDNFFASATSTLMVVTYLFHGNDFEFDTSTQFEGMRPERNTRNLFALLSDRGYRSNLIALNAFQHKIPTELPSWPEELSPPWGTNDFPALFARFDELTDAPPFAIYVWDLVTHIEHSKALAPHADGLTDQIRRACGVGDDAIGEMLAILERKGLMANTTIVVYGDHGDDFWTHGWKGGMVHGVEPYTFVTHTPLAIRDASLEAGAYQGLASTIDIAPTCLSLLGVDEAPAFAHTGIDLLRSTRESAYAQNLTANQPDNAERGIAQAFAATDAAYTLLASSRGLEMYAYRIDPGNHCNLLHFFDLAQGGGLRPRDTRGAPHFLAALGDNPHTIADIDEHFAALSQALSARIAAKRAYIAERGVQPIHALDPRHLARIDDGARATFFRAAAPAGAPASMPAFQFSYKVR